MVSYGRSHNFDYTMIVDLNQYYMKTFTEHTFYTIGGKDNER